MYNVCNKALYLYPGLIQNSLTFTLPCKNLIPDSGNSKNNHGIVFFFFCIIWDLFGNCYPMDWPNVMLEYTQVHHCKSAIEQT